MKIFEVAWHVDNKKIKEINYSYTGGSLVINNLTEYIGRIETVFLFIGREDVPFIKMDNFTILANNQLPETVLHNIRENEADENEARILRRKYAFESAIKIHKPNIVNFHDIGQMTQALIPICVKHNIQYVVTNHLFIGKHPDFTGYERWQQVEDNFFNNFDANIITVSAKQKNKICSNYPHYNASRIQPIPNGTDYFDRDIPYSIREKYSIDQNRKILISSGSLINRKNHKQIIHALALLDEGERENIVVVICGRGKEAQSLKSIINEKKFQEHVILAGPVEPEEMPAYYAEADGYIMPSKAEGLSISALEAISFGKPVILFNDSECIEELYDKNVISISKSRTDHHLASAIRNWYNIQWDHDYIRTFSRRFTMENMAKNYIQHYNSALSGTHLKEK